ncbi:chaperonin 10-like protein [Mycena rosella]|uniref:Chaperonin 10-like protein n=1 Tax=Mycena rosella TaxID=1033263 RepID=A0AAD7CNK4_MYCRO|nr:chaperonin 10-like protein [Mycena rosella]
MSFTIPRTQKAAIVSTASAKIQIKTDHSVESQAELAPGECHHLHAAAGDWPLTASTSLIDGHEGVSIIVGIGDNSTHSPWLTDSCFNCEHCRKGREQNCAEAKLSGFTVDGTFSQYVVSYVNHVTLIPAGFDSNAAASILCAGVTTYRAIKYSNTSAGDCIVIPGAGGGLGHLGVYSVHYAKARGLRVIAIDTGAAKKALCLSLGAEARARGRRHRGAGYQQAVAYLRAGGTLMAVGLPGHATRTLDASIFVTGPEALEIAARGGVRCVFELRGLRELEATYQGM